MVGELHSIIRSVVNKTSSVSLHIQLMNALERTLIFIHK